MSIIEKKEKNLNQLINKLNSLSLTYSQPNYEVEKIKTEKNEITRQKNEIEKKNQELLREHKYLKDKILTLQSEVKKRSQLEDSFSQEIDELSQETENLVYVSYLTDTGGHMMARTISCSPEMHWPFGTEWYNTIHKKETELFSGEFWSGAKAKDLGLIDEVGDAHQILREKFGEDVVIKKFEKTKSWLSKKLSASTDHVDQFANILEEKSVWQKYGL